MTKHDKVEIDNSGINKGVVVGNNTGTITMTMNETKKLPSLMSVIIKNLGVICYDLENEESSDDLKAFKTDEKLLYNGVIKYSEIIKENSVYYTLCDNMLNTYDNSNLGSKQRILKCVRTWYLIEKGDVLFRLKDEESKDIEKIQSNADQIIDKVKQKIQDIVVSSGIDEVCAEDIELGVVCFVCYCFMECKILEKPV